MFTSGQLLAERYRLARRIAVGGMGEVWEAEDIRLDRNVAVKVLKPELCGHPEFLHRFRTEARTTAALNHPGIAAVHDYGETAATPDGPEDTAYLVMELVAGEPLAAVLAREGRIQPGSVLDLLEQAGHALQAAHERGLVHRDVKPGNILVTSTGTVKLTDFGIAKAADAAPVTRSGMVMGTAHYIAPEQALGSEATPFSDVYSLAVVGYECLVGHRPFLSDHAVSVAMMHIRDVPPPLPAHVPAGTRALIEATPVKDPRRRYGTGGEFAAAVAAVRAGLALPVPAALLALRQQATVRQEQLATTPLPAPMAPVRPGGAAIGNGVGPVGQDSSGFHPHGGNARRRTGEQGRTAIWVVLVILLIAVLALGIWGLVMALRPEGPDRGRLALAGGAIGRAAHPSPADPPDLVRGGELGHTAGRGVAGRYVPSPRRPGDDEPGEGG